MQALFVSTLLLIIRGNSVYKKVYLSMSAELSDWVYNKMYVWHVTSEDMRLWPSRDTFSLFSLNSHNFFGKGLALPLHCLNSKYTPFQLFPTQSCQTQCTLLFIAYGEEKEWCLCIQKSFVWKWMQQARPEYIHCSGIPVFVLKTTLPTYPAHI